MLDKIHFTGVTGVSYFSTELDNINKYLYLMEVFRIIWAWGDVVVKALRY
jgi:hypothetical protein